MDKHQTRKSCSFSILTALLTMCISQGIALADTPGNHPEYLHARSDLRKADRLLNVRRHDFNVMRDMQVADDEINAAIREIDRAAIIDRKDIDDHPQIDVSLNRPGRLRAVLQLLNSARQDLTQTEDNYRAREWRRASLYHVNRAIFFANKTINDYREDRYRGY